MFTKFSVISWNHFDDPFEGTDRPTPHPHPKKTTQNHLKIKISWQTYAKHQFTDKGSNLCRPICTSLDSTAKSSRDALPLLSSSPDWTKEEPRKFQSLIWAGNQAGRELGNQYHPRAGREEDGQEDQRQNKTGRMAVSESLNAFQLLSLSVELATLQENAGPGGMTSQPFYYSFLPLDSMSSFPFLLSSFKHLNIWKWRLHLIFFSACENIVSLSHLTSQKICDLHLISVVQW